MQIENLINKSTDTKNTDTKTINDMTAGMRVSDYIKTDSSDNMSKKAAVVGSSNSVDMSDTIYARPQAKNEAGNNDGTDMAENLLNDMNQTSENRRNDMIVTASTTTSDDYKAAKDDGYDVIVTETDKIKAVLAKAGTQSLYCLGIKLTFWTVNSFVKIRRWVSQMCFFHQTIKTFICSRLPLCINHCCHAFHKSVQICIGIFQLFFQDMCHFWNTETLQTHDQSLFLRC